MSSMPSSHGSSRGIDYRPSTPDHTRPTLTRSNSVAPKSEYLRNALQARRAQNTSTPIPQDIKLSSPLAHNPPEISTPNASPDVFDQFALTEEQTTPVSPIRRRRPSDVGPPRTRTNRELTNEIEKLKDTLMTTNMRVELLKKNNTGLHHELTAAKEQIERLEPLEDENYELNAENKQLKIKLEKMDVEISNLRDVNEDYWNTNEELTAIASESAAHWSDHEFAIEEAAECIIKMEEEKDLLCKELKQLKDRVMAIESHSPASTLVNSSPGKFPLRVFSVDESRPPTSHFDSDYYSQSDSPQTKPSRESFKSSEMSKKFLDSTEERRRSARDLVERMSAVSLKALRDGHLSPALEVPQVPTTYQQQVPSIVADDRSCTPSQRREPHRQNHHVRPLLMDAAEISPPRPHTCAPQAPAPQPEGLRGLYRPRRDSSRASNDRRPSSCYISSSTNPASSFSDRQQSGNDGTSYIPSRTISKHIHTDGPHVHPQRHAPRHRNSDAALHTPHSNPQSTPSGWQTTVLNYSPASNASTADLPSEVDPRRAKDSWWRNLDGLTHSQALAQQQQQQQQQPQNPHHQHPPHYSDMGTRPLSIANPAPPPDISRAINATLGPPRRSNSTASHVRSSDKTGHRKSNGRATPTPSMALGSHPVERDYLFNAKESEEDFLRKTRGGGLGAPLTRGGGVSSPFTLR